MRAVTYASGLLELLEVVWFNIEPQGYSPVRCYARLVDSVRAHGEFLWERQWQVFVFSTMPVLVAGLASSGLYPVWRTY